jgi:hypothetical protein
MVTAGLRRVLAQLARSGKLGRHLSSVMDSVPVPVDVNAVAMLDSSTSEP